MRLKAIIFGLALLFAGSGLAQTYVELILDASGSMWNKLADDRYRIVAAKDVLTSFVSNLPGDPALNVGLRVYGSQKDALDEGACEDSQLFVGLDGLARQKLLGTIRDTEARGATPIAYSLTLAAQDFPQTADKRLIVLVTDGEESCGGDVRAVAEQLKQQGFEIDLRIIGFDLDERAKKSFEGVGTFENATSAAELAAALGRAVKEVVEEVEASYLVTVAVTRQGAAATDGAAVSFVEAVSGESYGFVMTDPGTFTAELPAGSFSAEVEDAFSDGVQSFAGLNITPESENIYSFELAAEIEVSLTVTPTDPVAGSTVTVSYEGAATGNGNWITVVPVSDPDELYLDWEYVEDLSGQVELRLPEEVTTLEARYHLALPEGGTRVIGRSEPFSTSKATASLEAPAEVATGAQFNVSWAGPNNQSDFVTIVPLGADEGNYGNYFYTSRGNPGEMTAPIEAGDYELRYLTGQGYKTLANIPITVTEVSASLEAAAEVAAGSSFMVSWTGPDNQSDFVTIVPLGADEGNYGNYFYTSRGNPGEMTAPIETGNYEIRYLTGQGYKTLANIPITVTEVSASLEAAAEVAAGADFMVSWTGPDNRGDIITIVPLGASEGSYKGYFYTSRGNPGELTAPIETGNYEIRYLTGQGYKTLVSIPITVR